MGEPVLTLTGVVKRFGGFAAVDGLSFDVRRGEIFGFLGPNGAGKTTTLRMILGIAQPSGGEISVLGAPSAAHVRRRVGYLPEERGLYRKMRAAESIAYFARLRGLSGKEAFARAHALLARFGLANFAAARCEALSKGMAQKVQFLAAIAHEPELLILDEPFTGLDPINQHALEDLLRELRAAGRTIVFSTHVMQHAERLCDRVLILAKGRKRFEGRIEEARAAFPPRLVLRTADSVDGLKRVPGVRSIAPLDASESGACDYAVVLAQGADPQVVLRAAFDLGLRLSRFEHSGASLHDIFVALAQDEPAQELAAEEAA
jgi:ABC-2 type transport system ATP-binding protein